MASINEINKNSYEQNEISKNAHDSGSCETILENDLRLSYINGNSYESLSPMLSLYFDKKLKKLLFHMIDMTIDKTMSYDMRQFFHGDTSNCGKKFLSLCELMMNLINGPSMKLDLLYGRQIRETGISLINHSILSYFPSGLIISHVTKNLNSGVITKEYQLLSSYKSLEIEIFSNATSEQNQLVIDINDLILSISSAPKDTVRVPYMFSIGN